MTQICIFNTRLFSLHNTLNYAIHRACLRMILLTDVYRNLTSLWIKPWERAFKRFKSLVLNVLIIWIRIICLSQILCCPCKHVTSYHTVIQDVSISYKHGVWPSFSSWTGQNYQSSCQNASQNWMWNCYFMQFNALATLRTCWPDVSLV